MKLIDVLNHMFINHDVVIKHIMGIGDSQHYIYKGSVAPLRFHRKNSYILDREVCKICANKSTIIIVIK
jgi:hypothetical protein